MEHRCEVNELLLYNLTDVLVFLFFSNQIWKVISVDRRYM